MMENGERMDEARRCAPSEKCKGAAVCAALGELSPDEAGLEGEVAALLSCKSFLWDVLLEGEWSGCSRQLIRALARRHGPAAVRRAFERA